MTDTSHRTYAVALALVVFFVSWAAVSARPWAAVRPDPRVEALRAREQHLRVEAKVVRSIVDRRWVAYQVALRARRVEIAQARVVPVQAIQAPSVRVVTLPPLTVTRSS